MYQTNWINGLLNLGLCFGVITAKDLWTEKKILDESVGGNHGGTNGPDSWNPSVYEPLWRKSSGFPLGESSTFVGSSKELKPNEQEHDERFSTLISTIPSTTSLIQRAREGHEELTFVQSSSDETEIQRNPGSAGSSIGGSNSHGSSSSSSSESFRKWPKKGEQEEKMLLSYLMDGYEKDVRPVRNSSQPILIEVGITLTQIFDMDEKNQVLTTTVWLDQVTAITLIAASGILLYKSNQTLLAWLKAAPTTLNILSEVSKVFGGTSSIVEEVESQERYLRILILCSATIIVAGSIQLICNIWFFYRHTREQLLGFVYLNILNPQDVPLTTFPGQDSGLFVQPVGMIFPAFVEVLMKFYFEWYDELLTWTPTDFYNMTSIRLPCHKIWLPDIVLYNSADDYTRGYFASRAMVNHDGKIFWPPPTKFRSTCPVDVTYFPFDDQICKLKLGSWTYNGFQVDVTNRTSEVDLTNYIPSGEWELLGAELQRNVVYYSCCPEPFPDVTITLIIRRKTLFYVFNVIIPCILLSFLTLLVFFLPPDSGEKVALGITVLLAFSVFMLAIAEKMPETSESIPLIGIYLTAVMIITSISVVVTVIVLNLHYLGPRVEAVPNWLRYLLPNEDKEFIMRQRNEISAMNPFEAEQTSLVSKQTVQTNKVLISHHQDHLGRCSAASVTTCLNVPPQIHNENTGRHPSSMTFDSEEINENEPGEGGQYVRNRHNYNHRQSINNLSETNAANIAHSACAVPPSLENQIQTEVAKSLRHLIQKQTESEQQQILVSEWRLAAQVVDKILFWVFFVVTLVSSGIFLLILPLYKRSWNGPMPPD